MNSGPVKKTPLSSTTREAGGEVCHTMVVVASTTPPSQNLRDITPSTLHSHGSSLYERLSLDSSHTQFIKGGEDSVSCVRLIRKVIVPKVPFYEIPGGPLTV